MTKTDVKPAEGYGLPFLFITPNSAITLEKLYEKKGVILEMRLRIIVTYFGHTVGTS